MAEPAAVEGFGVTMRGLALGLAALAAIVQPAPAGPYGDQKVVVHPRAGVDLPYWFSAPTMTSQAGPRRAVVLFIGANGVLEGAEKNFLLRVWKMFRDKGFFVAIPDTPSDHPQGLLDDYRSRPAHADDIRAVLKDFANRIHPPVPIWLIGTSRGSISAANGAARIPGVAGAVLTSTVTHHYPDPNGKDAIDNVPLDQIAVPVFLLGHRHDACNLSPPSDMAIISKLLSGTTHKKVDLVEGGLPPGSGPCGALSPHGFYGVEAEAIGKISAFIANPMAY